MRAALPACCSPSFSHLLCSKLGPSRLAPAGATGLSGGEESLLRKLRPGRRRRDLLDPGGERVWPARRKGERQSLGTMAGFSALGLLSLCQLLATASAQVRNFVCVSSQGKTCKGRREWALCVVPVG